jgi:hypothetical protein
MRLTPGFYLFAKLGIMSNDEQGGEEIAGEGGGRTLGRCSGSGEGGEEPLDLFGAALYLLFVVHEIDADEHESREFCTIILIILEDDIRILIEEAEALLILLVQFARTFSAMQMTEELDELVLEMTYDRVLNQFLSIRRLQSDISNTDAWDSDTHLILEHREHDGEEHLTLALTDLFHHAITACHRSTDDRDLIALTDLIRRFAIDNLEIITLDDRLETLHLGITNLYRVAMFITISEDAMTKDLAPRRVQEF